MGNFKFAEDFLFGTATSSVQIEGGDTNNTWYEWSELGYIKDSSSCFTACDHWNRVEEDTKILQDLNVQTHRLSLEWSRIEPQPGQYSEEAIRHYREEIKLLLASKIEPLVTLHHFSEPIWFQQLGGWSKPENKKHFIAYVQYVVEKLGDLVSEWVTFNEPNVYANLGYLLGIFPPGKRSLLEYFKITSALIETHIELYTLIHELRACRGFLGQTKVGVAMHIRFFDGLTWLGRRTAALVDYFFHQIFIEGMVRGKLKFPLISLDHKKIKKTGYADFFGINYYTRNIVEFSLNPSIYFHKCVTDKKLDKSDLCWDIYPEGIYRVCCRYYRKYKLPVYITENGLSDRADRQRAKFIVDHLAYLAKAIQEGIEIQRYYHWTVMDNFEWLEGESAAFGLYHCDFRTQQRTPRPSAMLYAQICKTKIIEQNPINN
ncbi:MAG: glycoside hydrolase family 1 protein [Peptococcaceae bacterium]|jgi:beta-glucosidase|nr:glycoside hydrolase family 1 protein [Peptococcaceae bacterium]